jgi:hypothetical protein
MPWTFNRDGVRELVETKNPDLILAFINAALCKQKPELASYLLDKLGDDLVKDSEVRQAERFRRRLVISRTETAAKDAMGASRGHPHTEVTAQLGAAVQAASSRSGRGRRRARDLIEPILNSPSVSWLHYAESRFLFGVIGYHERSWPDAYSNLIAAQFVMDMMAIRPPPMFRLDLVASDSSRYLTPFEILRKIPLNSRCRTVLRQKLLIENGLRQKVLDSLFAAALGTGTT